MSDVLPNGERGRRRGSSASPCRAFPPTASSGSRRAGQASSRASGAPPEEKPLAVVAKIKNALRVVAVDRLAERRGIRLGQSLADARGAVPDLGVAEADEAADRALLEAIADWCDRYTPLVALDPPHGLFLDISGCAHLFAEGGGDGEAALLSDCLAPSRRAGI